MKLGNTRYMQYIAAFTAALTVTTAALYATWTSPIFPKIDSGDAPLGEINVDQRSWIVSSLSLGLIPGSLISGWTIEKFGRRGSLLLCGIPLLLPWFVLSFTSSVWIVCIVRFIAGMAMSNALCAVIMYNAEIEEKEIRGRLGSMFNIQDLIGELVTFCIGPYVSYLTLTMLSSAVPAIFLIVFYFMPESPHYLAKIGKEDEAKDNLKRLLKNDVTTTEIEEHMKVIKKSVGAESSLEKTSLWDFLSNKEYRKVLLLSLGIQVLHQFSGYIAIISYMQTIIQRSESSITPEVSSMICGLVQFPAVFVAAALVDYAGRKPLLIISSLGCGFALLMEGVYFYLQDIVEADVSNLAWIPTTGILIYVVMRPIGIGTLTVILLGELFPANIKSYAVSTSSFINNILSFAVAKLFEPVSNVWGIHVMFVLFSVVCALGAFFVYVAVPETKGITFLEINEKVNGKKINNDSKPV